MVRLLDTGEPVRVIWTGYSEDRANGARVDTVGAVEGLTVEHRPPSRAPEPGR